jgi:phage antirepressor YoqD-like protein
MNELTVFENKDFGQIRIITEDGRSLFCGSDVTKSLGYSNSRDALSRHCRGVVKRDTLTKGGIQSISYIPEGDLYRLITHSQLPDAEKFESWVFDEVLPSIRKHGAYLTDEATDALFSSPDTFAKLAVKWRDERHARLAAEEEARARQQKIEADAPKVLFADSVAASKSEILVGELAKILKQNGIDMGQNRLFERLRKDGYLINRKGTDWNMPTQRSMDLGVMRIKETSVTHADGHVTVSKTPKVTGKGQVYFINRYSQG